MSIIPWERAFLEEGVWSVFLFFFILIYSCPPSFGCLFLLVLLGENKTWGMSVLPSQGYDMTTPSQPRNRPTEGVDGVARLDRLPVLDSGKQGCMRGRLPSWAWHSFSMARPPSALPTFPRKMNSACGVWGRGMALDLDPCCATEVWSGESLVLGLGDHRRCWGASGVLGGNESYFNGTQNTEQVGLLARAVNGILFTLREQRHRILP